MLQNMKKHIVTFIKGHHLVLSIHKLLEMILCLSNILAHKSQHIHIVADKSLAYWIFLFGSSIATGDMVWNSYKSMNRLNLVTACFACY